MDLRYVAKEKMLKLLGEVLRSKQIQLKKQGKGNNCHKADALSDEDIDALFRTGELGFSNPTSLLHSLWFFNTVFFGLPGIRAPSDDMQ